VDKHKRTYHLTRNDPISVSLHFLRERVKCSILSSSYIFRSSCQAPGNIQLLLSSKRDVNTASSFDIAWRCTMSMAPAFTFRREFQLLGSKLSYSVLLVILDQSCFVPRSLHFKGEVSLNQHERTCRKISTLPSPIHFPSLHFISLLFLFFTTTTHIRHPIPSHPSIQSFLLFTVLPLHLHERTSPRTHHHLLDWTPPWPR
jgi:hypothetical protein